MLILYFNIIRTSIQNLNYLCLWKFLLLKIGCIFNYIELKTTFDRFFLLKIAVFIFNVNNIYGSSRWMRSLVISSINFKTFSSNILFRKIFKRIIINFVDFLFLIAFIKTFDITRFWFNELINLKQDVLILKLFDFILYINLKHFLVICLHNLICYNVII